MSKTPTDQALFKAAEAIRAKAYAPYSRFSVGAAILADDGIDSVLHAEVATDLADLSFDATLGSGE